MPIQDQASDLLQTQAFPELAEAIRKRSERIMDRWEKVVRETLPRADKLPAAQLRDHLPQILDLIATALETQPEYKLIGTTLTHGARRFHVHYDLQTVIIEFRLLRRVLVEELSEALGNMLTADEVIALGMGVDIALQESVTGFLEHQQAKLGAATEAEAKYLAFLSHDLRNNLNSVMLTLEVLGHDLAGAPQFAERAEDVAAAQQAIRDTVSGMSLLLQAEQVRKGTMEPKREVLDLHTVAAQVVKQAQPQATKKGVNLSLAMPQEQAVVNSDRGLIGLILQNLVGNAVKYSPSGSTVTVEAQPPTEGHEEGWALSVADQGPGITNERRLSAPFVRGETHGEQGAGLGLSIVHEASALLGARVAVDSKPGVGTVFRVALPAEG
ncbi:MAG TPA: sensor histidine kinase [Tepidisphaeraceae bacterium]|jgi:signal transduction histidine kinase|nr:sensor histidine kinase [Tepidisphaeraceae bacterium]